MHVSMTMFWWQESTSCQKLVLSLPLICQGFQPKCVCQPGFFGDGNSQSLQEQTLQGGIKVSKERNFCHADPIFFPGSLYPRWTFHSRLLPQGRSIGRDKPKAGNRAGTARLHLFPFLFEPSIELLSSVRGVNKGEHSQRLGWMETRGCGELLLCLIGIQFSYIPWSDRGLWL